MSKFEEGFARAMKAARKPARPMADRVLDEIWKHPGTINSAMIAADFRVRYETIRRVTAKLEAAGRIERNWDGDGWIPTEKEQRARAEDAYFRKAFPSTRSP